MRCPHMGGSFEFPVKYGYVSVGVVEACGKDVEHLRNARVFCLHPHQDAYVVPAADVRVVPGTVLAWPQSTSAALVATTRAGAEPERTSALTKPGSATRSATKTSSVLTQEAWGPERSGRRP